MMRRLAQHASTLLSARCGRLCLSWLLWVALVVQILAAATASGTATARTLSAGLDDDRMVICTAAGMVVLDQNGTIPAEPGMSGMCIFCLPLLHAGLTTPDIATAEPVHHFARAEPFARGSVAHSPLPVHDHTAPRAPPTV
jgi:hypothetical protein